MELESWLSCIYNLVKSSRISSFCMQALAYSINVQNIYHIVSELTQREFSEQ